MILFDNQTRQFSTHIERKLERKYNHYIADGYTHDAAIKKLEEATHRKRVIGHAINTADSVKGLLNIPYITGRKDLSKSNKSTIIGLGATANLALHGGVGYLIERNNKKRKAAINVLREHKKI